MGKFLAFLESRQELPAPMSDQLFLRRAKLGLSCEYKRTLVPFCSQPEQLPRLFPGTCLGYPVPKLGRMQPCSLACPRFPSSPAAESWQDREVLQMQPCEPSPLTPTSCCPPQPVPAAHPPARLLIAPRMSSNTNTLLELLIFSPRLGHKSFFLAANGAGGAGESLVLGCAPTRANQEYSQLFHAGVLLATAAWRDMALQVLQGEQRQLAQTQVAGARLGAGQRLPAWCATSAKRAGHRVSTGSMGGSPALPWILSFVPGPSDTELQR